MFSLDWSQHGTQWYGKQLLADKVCTFIALCLNYLFRGDITKEKLRFINAEKGPKKVFNLKCEPIFKGQSGVTFDNKQINSRLAFRDTSFHFRLLTVKQCLLASFPSSAYVVCLMVSRLTITICNTTTRTIQSTKLDHSLQTPWTGNL